MVPSLFFSRICCALAVALCAPAWAGAPLATQPSAAAGERDVSQWLMRIHEASRQRSYVGTFVVLSAAGGMSSSRIWHACDGAQQLERVEALTGTPRSTFRHNDHVITFLPDLKLARVEQRESLGLFPNLLQAPDSAIPEFYAARHVGTERVAGFDADVVVLKPRDGLRFGYRIWSEKRTGLAMQLQTLDTDGRVLEQVAFSELEIDAPVRMDKLSRMMGNRAGYKVERPDLAKTTAAAEGWQLKAPVPGFRAMSCYRRPFPAGGVGERTMQWIFSDGLATVSLFVAPYDAQRNAQAIELVMGATRTLMQRVADDWWLTAVGEVPMQTLKAFAGSLERVAK
ncbi:MucB/RseB C-terminal domain-containing protein [Ramlibacter sp. H39-3-26]|uniref:MucB/RseB C-terminal domain-containing protein n=1 Tax=Curvibacter soli TaxID=3031331 RepID=UPI0023DC6D2E|nr:MucB/RseB C-terminal domain-containing protein [Ramlibacter sp. H39-3-26]MDF1484358.1 MucB/RseB C-terminal domain-containing protein [Ramlibacter sp. H39-3-26]